MIKWQTRHCFSPLCTHTQEDMPPVCLTHCIYNEPYLPDQYWGVLIHRKLTWSVRISLTIVCISEKSKQKKKKKHLKEVDHINIKKWSKFYSFLVEKMLLGYRFYTVGATFVAFVGSAAVLSFLSKPNSCWWRQCNAVGQHLSHWKNKACPHWIEADIHSFSFIFPFREHGLKLLINFRLNID